MSRYRIRICFTGDLRIARARLRQQLHNAGFEDIMWVTYSLGAPAARLESAHYWDATGDTNSLLILKLSDPTATYDELTEVAE